jgi:hypothetical protein
LSLRQRGDDFGGDGHAADAVGIVRIGSGPDARFGSFDRQIRAAQQPVRDVETAAAEARDALSMVTVSPYRLGMMNLAEVSTMGKPTIPKRLRRANLS